MTNSTEAIEAFEVPADLTDNSLSTRLSELKSRSWNLNDSDDTCRLVELLKGVPADTPVLQLSILNTGGTSYTLVPKAVVPEHMQNCLEGMISCDPIRDWECLLWRPDNGFVACICESGVVRRADVCSPYSRFLHHIADLPKTFLEALPVDTVFKEFPAVMQVGEHAGKISYYPNGYASDAKQQYMKAGRYAKRARPDLSAERIKNLAADVASAVIQAQLNFTEAGDCQGIAKVYIDGPSSCMAGSGRHYHDSLVVDGRLVHPTEVYGHPDNNLRLAYLTFKDDIVARAWTNCRTMTYSTIYSKTDQYSSINEIFHSILEEAGYSHDPESTVRDEKLLRIELDNGAIICPYIDPGNLGVRVEDDCLIASGPYETNYETGCLHEWDNDAATEYCDPCGEYRNADSVTYSEHLGSCICNDCADYHTEHAIVSVYRGRAQGDYVWNEDARELARPFQGYHYVFVDTEDFVEVTAGANEGMYLHIDDVHIDDNGNVWDMHYIEDSNLFICEDCRAVCSSEEYNHEECSCLECSPLEDAQLEGAVA